MLEKRSARIGVTKDHALRQKFGGRKIHGPKNPLAEKSIDKNSVAEKSIGKKSIGRKICDQNHLAENFGV